MTDMQGETMMRKGLIFLLLMIYPMVFASRLAAVEAQWKLDKDKHGVQSYSRAVYGSSIKEYRAVAVANYPIEVLLEVLIDVPSFPKWMPNCKEAEILKEFHKGLERGNYYVHIVFSTMWPASERDLILESVPKTDWDKGVSVIRLNKLENYPLPLKKGLVRVQEFSSEFKFEYISRDKTMVTFTTYVDPVGSVPLSLAAMQTSNVPYGTLVGLQKIAADPRYHKAAARDYY